MHQLLLLGMGGLLLLGCTAHTPRARGQSLPARPRPAQKANPHASKAPDWRAADWRATSASALPPVFPKPAGGAGVLVGSLAMPRASASQLPCGWGDIRFRSLTNHEGVPSFEASFLKTQPYREHFQRKALEGEVFAFSLPKGRYEIHSAELVCIDPKGFERQATFTADQKGPFEFEVAPGKITYLGAISFRPNPAQPIFGAGTRWSGPSIIVEDQWDRDGRLLENSYPLIDWNETVMSSMAGPVQWQQDDAPVPRLLERVIEEPIAPRASEQELVKACADGAAEGCFNLGILYWKARGSNASASSAAALFETACEGGVGQACFNFGTFHLQGWAVSNPNLGQAARLFDKACKSGTLWACLSLGKMYEEGLGGVYLPKDEERAVELYQRVCTQGVVEGCFVLGMLHLKATAVVKDRRQGITLLEQGCANGYPKACYAMAQLKEE